MKIKIKVKPNSSKQEIEEKDGIYLVKLKSSPVDNKANLELIKICTQGRIPRRDENTQPSRSERRAQDLFAR